MSTWREPSTNNAFWGPWSVSLRPYAAVTDEIAAPFLRVHEADTVERTMLPGSNISGLLRRPLDACNSHSPLGRYQRRPENESSGPKSKSHRFSSGSRPLKMDPSITKGP